MPVFLGYKDLHRFRCVPNPTAVVSDGDTNMSSSHWGTCVSTGPTMLLELRGWIAEAASGPPRPLVTWVTLESLCLQSLGKRVNVLQAPSAGKLELVPHTYLSPPDARDGLEVTTVCLVSL